jgi:hypothetical protein
MRCREARERGFSGANDTSWLKPRTRAAGTWLSIEPAIFLLLVQKSCKRSGQVDAGALAKHEQ